jgi:hypothetical protein
MLMDEKARRFRPLRFGLAGLFAVVGVSAIVAALWSPFPKPSLANLFKVQMNMTRAEVEELVGPPNAMFRANGVGEVAYGGPDGLWQFRYVNGRVQMISNLRVGSR